jgi:dipeptidyl aminopeptidase/acylaminoacyl peptidase
VPLKGGLPSMTTAKPQPVSTAPGYDNQPNFSPDGARILFAANRDDKQTDIYAFDRKTNRVTQVTRTAEKREFADVRAVRRRSERQLHRGAVRIRCEGTAADACDSTIVALQQGWAVSVIDPADVTPLAITRGLIRIRLALFVLGNQGKPATLQLASVKTGKTEVIAEGIGRSLHRIPGGSLVSFVHREGDDYIVKQLDPNTKKVTPLMKAVAGSSDRDMVWMPDGKTMLMSSGTRIFSWTRGANSWSEVFDAAAHQLGVVTRMAVSPKGDAIAFVVAEPKK